MQGTAKPLVVPQLAGHDKAWFLLSTSRPLNAAQAIETEQPKPSLDREPIKRVSLSSNEESKDNKGGTSNEGGVPDENRFFES